jgi:hypothetical protein
MQFPGGESEWGLLSTLLFSLFSFPFLPSMASAGVHVSLLGRQAAGALLLTIDRLRNRDNVSYSACQTGTMYPMLHAKHRQ